jgi:GT2 family glycosyltransferase
MKQPSDDQLATTSAASGEVKARLFPASSLETKMEAWLERLPRQHLSVTLVPQQDLVCVNAARGEYRSVGRAPRFKLHSSGTFSAGWYYLETSLTRNNGSRSAKLIAHTANGPLETLVPSILRGTVREVFYLAQGVQSLIWQPTEAPGFLTQAPVLLHKISTFESAARRCYRVVGDLWRHRHLPPSAKAGLSWTLLLGRLQKAYLASAKLRITRLYSTDTEVFMSRQEALARADTDSPGNMHLTQHPLISVLMPVLSADLALLRQSMESLRKQAYPTWECVVACGANVPEGAWHTLRAAAQKDPRIKVLEVSASHTHVALLNQALALAQGEWVMRLNPHDRLPKTALLQVAHQAGQAPQVQLMYGDHDSIDTNGHRSQPCFKPAWNPDLFHSHNYMGPAVVHRREHMLSLGGYAADFEGAEDHELGLRCVHGIAGHQIGHIKKVLYHQNSRGACIVDAYQAHDAGRRALQLHLKAGATVEVLDGPAPGMYRIKHVVAAEPPLVSIIIPTRDKVEVLRACMQSIQHKTTYPRWEMLIVDNGSKESETHAYLDSLGTDDRIRVLRYDAPFNYSAINNFAAGHAKGEVLALLNNDVEVIEADWLQEMVGHAMRPEVGAVGAKLLYPDGTVQHAGVVVNESGAAGHAHRFLPADAPGYCSRAVLTQNVSAVTGACLVVKKRLYVEVGGLDAVHFQVAFNDIDFCLRLERTGYSNVFTPYALLYHHESLTRGVEGGPGEQAFFGKMYRKIKNINEE